MFAQGEKVGYGIKGRGIVNTLIIERLVNPWGPEGKQLALSTSGSFGDMGPFLMTFDAKTGEGLGDYEGAYIAKL